MRQIVTGLAVVLGLILIANVSDAAPKKKAALRDVTLTGTITKTEKKRGENTTVTYVLINEDGTKATLPKSKAKGDEEAINLEDYVDAKVKLVGKGIERGRGGKKRITIRTIVSVEEVEEDVEALAEEEIPMDEGGR